MEKTVITVIHEERETQWPDDAAAGESLWLDAAAIAAATGWAWKPQGLCHGDDLCVPVPPASREQLVRAGRLDLAAMWRLSGQPVVHDRGARTWVLGTGASRRAAALVSLQAPDFALPDLAGTPHRLSDYRGRKVFLATWASW